MVNHPQDAGYPDLSHFFFLAGFNRAVNGVEYQHVFPSFLAADDGLSILPDTSCEVVDLDFLLEHGFEAEYAASGLAGDAAVLCGRIEFNESAGASCKKSVDEGNGPGIGVAKRTISELQLPGEDLRHLRENFLSFCCRLGRDVHGFLSLDVACTLYGIDAKIIQGASAHAFHELPRACFRCKRISKRGFDVVDWSEGLALSKAFCFDEIRIIVHAVADRELAVGLLCRLDHLLGLARGQGHGFFADDVFASLKRLDGIFGMHAVGQYDVDNIDVLVVGDVVEVRIVVDILLWNVVLFRPSLCLCGCTRDDPRKVTLICFSERSGKHGGAVIAEANEGDTRFFCLLRDGCTGKGWHDQTACGNCRSVFQELPTWDDIFHRAFDDEVKIKILKQLINR